MAFVLSEEQQQLQDSARVFLAQESPVAAQRKLRNDGSELRYDPEIWERFAEMGWTAMTIPKVFGGLEFGVTGMGILFHEMGRNLTASPLFASCVIANEALRCADAGLKKELLPSIAGGRLTVALAIDEGQHFDPARTAVVAEQRGDGYVLNGVKTFVPDGGFADVLIVCARTAGVPGDESGISLFCVNTRKQGTVQRRPVQLMDSRNYAEISLKDVEVPASALLGEVGQGMQLVDRLIDVASVVLACEMLGLSQECFDRTIDYMKEREQFGVKIGSFQALQHRASLLYIKLELLRSVVLDALAALADERQDASLSASHAKALAIDVSAAVTSDAIQLHGGIGVTDDLDIGLFYKRAAVLGKLYGNRSYHTDRFARLSGF